MCYGIISVYLPQDVENKMQNSSIHEFQDQS